MLVEPRLVARTISAEAIEPSGAVGRPAGERGAEPVGGARVTHQPRFIDSDRIMEARACRQHRQRAIGERCRIGRRSEEHTSELQSLMRNSYAVFCLKKKKTQI